MPHVSKATLAKKYQGELIKKLYTCVANSSKRGTNPCLDELLTATEKTMLAKRWAAIVMFERGYTAYRVWNTLKLSPSTANQIRLAHEIGDYRQTVKALKSSKKHETELWQLIDTLVRAGLPPMGKKRWDATLSAMLD